MKTLLLWDIDSTLLKTGPAGKRALLRGFAAMRGKAICSLDGIEVSGRTDPLILNDLCDLYGVGRTPESEARFYEAYLAGLEHELKRSPSRFNPGVREIVEEVHHHPEIAQGVLTGNCVAGARIKLSQPGIELWDRFPFGAFGDDGFQRNDLSPQALRRAGEHHGIDFDLSRVFVIGDTEYDVACGKAIGARTIAVLTGKHDRDRVARADPCFLFEDLGDVARFFEVIDHARS